MRATISGATAVAGIVGAPVRHSLSPLIHNGWLEAAGLDGVYVAFAPPEDGFEALADGFRGGAIRGLNVTVPFKARALALADAASARAAAAGAANLLIFQADGTIRADNTDGIGLLAAFAQQSPGFDPAAGPVVILGSGGAARGAAAAFAAAGAPEIRIVNRTLSKAQDLAASVEGAISAHGLSAAAGAFEGAVAVINATSAALSGDDLDLPLERTAGGAVVMDMVYTPLTTPFLARAKALGRPVVDGLAMLIGQAVPSFEAFYGQAPPAGVDIRGLALKVLEAKA